MFHCMPEPFRLLVVRKHLGPAPGWVPREYVEKHVAMQLGATITGIREVGGRAELSLRSADGVRTVAGDSVIAATGPSHLRRLTFIGRSVRGGLRSVSYANSRQAIPIVIPGLYFTGLTAANSFRPLLRFAYGAGFVARRLTDHLHRTLEKNRYAVRGPLRRSGRSRVRTRPRNRDRHLLVK